MKRRLLVLLCVVLSLSGLVLLTSALSLSNSDTRRPCTGYEVIEAGKGINCYGDTIKLTRRAGFYEVAANYSK